MLYKLFTFLLLVSLNSFSQKTIDSDSIKVEKLISLSNKYLFSNPDSTIILLKKAKSFQNLTIHSRIKIFNKLHIAFEHKNNLDSAYFYIKKAIVESKKNNLKKISAVLATNLGAIYAHQGEFNKALKQLFFAEDYFEKTEKSRYLFDARNNIGYVFQEKNKYKEAIVYHKKALVIANKKQTPIAYLNLSDCFFNLKKLDSALYYAKLALIKLKERKNTYNLADAEIMLAEIYSAKKKYKLAEKHLLNSLFLKKEIDINNTIRPLINLGDVLVNQKKYIKAERYYLEAENLCINIDDQIQLEEIYKNLGELYRKLKKYKLASEYLKKYIDVHAEINMIEKDKKINELIIKHNIKEKQQKIELLYQENKNKKQQLKINYYIITSLFLFIAIILILTYVYRQKSQQKFEQIENKLQKYLLKINNETAKLTLNLESFASKFNLSKRELEVLTLLSKGYSYAGIGDALFISKNTVKFHLKNIYSKLNVRSKAEALDLMN